MQIYHFFQHPSQPYICVQQDAQEAEAEFIWVDCTREDVVNRSEHWQQEIFQHTGLWLNEYHVRDILNLEHPCVFDTLDDYDLLIFRKLITPDDHVKTGEQALEQHEPVFGLATTPVSFIMTPQVLITVREQGNKAMENYIARIKTVLARPLDEQNRPRKLAASPLDLALRLLNGMVDGYLDLRRTLTRQIDHWQIALLKPNKRFSNWASVLDVRLALHQLDEICEDQRSAVQDWIDALETWAPPDTPAGLRELDLLKVRSRDVLEHIERVVHHVRRLEQSTETAVQMHFSVQSNRTNDIMRTLTALTAVFLPLNLIAGIFGMNFDFIPLIHKQDGFWWATGAMSVIAVALVLLFWRKRYLARTSTR